MDGTDYDTEIEEEEDDEEAEDQAKSKPSPADRIRPWMYKKGQSGNPSGRPHGISLKEYARVKFRTMTDEEREAFFHGMNKKDLWEMAEGKPEAKTDITSKGEQIMYVIAPEIASKNDINASAEDRSE